MKVQARAGRVLVVAATLLLTGVLFACGADPDMAARSATPGVAKDGAATEDFAAVAADFKNLHSMTKVRGFYVDNRLGHLAETVAMAQANKGGVYPVGTIMQLVPQEAMVKRRAGWSPATKDWEFFFLATSAQGTTILARGKDQVENRFKGNCASCHADALPKFDFVCEHSHGCEELPIGDRIIHGIQEADPRKL